MSSFTVAELKTSSEIECCVEMYYNLNDHSFEIVSKEESKKSLSQLVRKKSFVKVLKENGNIVAWILAVQTRKLHSTDIALQQIYYASNLTGFKAVRAVKMLHDAMETEGKRLKVDALISTGSHFDETHVFSKILEKHGWTRRGYLAIKRL